MKPAIERMLCLGVIAVLSVLMINEGRTQVRLERQLPYSVAELYDLVILIEKGETKDIQVIDARPLAGDGNDDVEGYEDNHIPHAIPFPDCDRDKTPDEAREHLMLSIPTILVTHDGDKRLIEKCDKQFARLRIVSGGMLAWDEAGYPTEDGEYSAPSMAAGGGCL